MNVIYAVKCEVDPVDEAVWDEWNTTQHIPDILMQPGFIRATKYKIEVESGWPQYIVLYELNSRASLDNYLNGEAVIRLRADHYTRFGNSTRLSRMLLMPTVSIDKDRPAPRQKKVSIRKKSVVKKAIAQKPATKKRTRK
ncbi:MAG TPA: DUF4286 family protein [Anaerolineae bacterium]|nr:DUF4286 family protein [Anaerolineae bacterium]